jgi:hypothetical protein
VVKIQSLLRVLVFMVSSLILQGFNRAKAECQWTATWRNHGSRFKKEFPVTEKEGVQFGLQTDFLCVVSPVSLLDERSKEEEPIKHIDMNCRYAEGERGMATGLAGIEQTDSLEVVHFFLTDQLGETSHSVTLKLFCDSEKKSLLGKKDLTESSKEDANRSLKK